MVLATAVAGVADAERISTGPEGVAVLFRLPGILAQARQRPDGEPVVPTEPNVDGARNRRAEIIVH